MALNRVLKSRSNRKGTRTSLPHTTTPKDLASRKDLGTPEYQLPAPTVSLSPRSDDQTPALFRRTTWGELARLGTLTAPHNDGETVELIDLADSASDWSFRRVYAVASLVSQLQEPCWNAEMLGGLMNLFEHEASIQREAAVRLGEALDQHRHALRSTNAAQDQQSKTGKAGAQ